MNFIESQKYLLLCTKLTGLTSYEYDRKKRTILKPSKIKQAIGCVIPLLILGISYSLMNNQIYLINNDIIQDGGLTSDAAVFIEICIYLFCTMLISINGFWTNKTQVLLLNRMLNFQHNNTVLRNFHKEMYAATNKRLILTFGSYTVVMSVAFFVIYYKFNVLNDIYSVYIFMYHCCCHNVMMCYLANIIDSLRYQLKCLNNDLKAMANTNCEPLALTNLVAALELHQIICNCFNLISRAFGLVIIGVFLATFLVTTMEVYVILVFASKGFNYFLVFYIGTDLCWTGLYMYFILMIFHKCSELSEEAQTTVVYIRQMDISNYRDNRLARCIKSFLIRNIQPNYKLTAFGLFELNNTMIYTLFSTTITYLVIMIQFNQLEESRNDMNQSHS